VSHVAPWANNGKSNIDKNKIIFFIIPPTTIPLRRGFVEQENRQLLDGQEAQNNP